MRWSMQLRAGLVAGVVILTTATGGCDQLTGTGEGTAWTITEAAGREGPLLTLKMQTTGTDNAGKPVPVEISLSGEGGSEWRGNPTVKLTIVAIGGPPMPEQPLNLIPDGMHRTVFGLAEPGSELRPAPAPAPGAPAQAPAPVKAGGGNTITCPSLTTVGSASGISMMRGAKFVDVNVGSLKLKLDDEHIRAMQELLRRIEATVPR